jgi:hypothetical protein
LRGLSREVERGKTYYEAETTVNGKSRDILMDATGAIVEVKEATAFESIPDAAQKALRTKAGSGKILRVESVTKGSTVGYEAVIEKTARRPKSPLVPTAALISNTEIRHCGRRIFLKLSVGFWILAATAALATAAEAPGLKVTKKYPVPRPRWWRRLPAHKVPG